MKSAQTEKGGKGGSHETNRILGVRLGELTAVVNQFEDETGQSAAALAAALMASAMKYWKENGEIKLPMVAIPRSEFESLSLTANAATLANAGNQGRKQVGNHATAQGGNATQPHNAGASDDENKQQPPQGNNSCPHNHPLKAA